MGKIVVCLQATFSGIIKSYDMVTQPLNSRYGMVKQPLNSRCGMVKQPLQHV